MGSFWAPVAAAGVSSIGSIAGGMIGAAGQAQTNAQQFQQAETLFDQQSAYNSNQANINREWQEKMEQRQTDQNWSAMRDQMAYSSSEAEKNRAFQSDQAQRQMDFQADMSSTAYQRAMADMKKAGLNPILSANLGGASTPSGAAGGGAMGSASLGGAGSLGGGSSPTAAGSAGHLGNPGEFLGKGIASASQVGRAYIDAQQAIQAIKESEARTEQSYSSAKQQDSQTTLNAATEARQKAEKAVADETVNYVKQNTATSAAQAASHAASAGLSSASAVNELVRNSILKHDVSTAKERADQEAERTRLLKSTGQGFAGDTLGAIKNTGQSVLDTLDSAVGTAIDVFKGGGAPVGPPLTPNLKLKGLR